jgi:hypothetical protein
VPKRDVHMRAHYITPMMLQFIYFFQIGFLPSGINFTSSVCFFFVSNALK